MKEKKYKNNEREILKKLIGIYKVTDVVSVCTKMNKRLDSIETNVN